MKTIDLQKQFKVKKNEDAKRWEFQSVNNNSVSYTVHFNEADNEADAYIAIFKAIKLEAQSV